MGIKKISNYKGRYCAELENGKFVMNNGSMYLILCEKVEKEMKVIKDGIVAGKMIRTQDDFRLCVKNTLKDFD